MSKTIALNVNLTPHWWMRLPQQKALFNFNYEIAANSSLCLSTLLVCCTIKNLCFLQSRVQTFKIDDKDLLLPNQK